MKTDDVIKDNAHSYRTIFVLSSYDCCDVSLSLPYMSLINIFVEMRKKEKEKINQSCGYTVFV